MGDRLATIDMGKRGGGAAVPLFGGAGSPLNTMWPGPRPISTPSGSLIRPTDWSKYTNVTDRTDRQRADKIGQTVLQTVAQNNPNFVRFLCDSRVNIKARHTLPAFMGRDHWCSTRVSFWIPVSTGRVYGPFSRAPVHTIREHGPSTRPGVVHSTCG